MKRFALIHLLTLVPVTLAVAADSPFTPLLKHLDAQGGEWDTDNEEVARIFHACVKTITNDSHAAILEFLGPDLRRHYWISAYLVEDCYLHGSTPDAEFAMLILCQATKIAPREDAELVLALGVRVKLAVLAKRRGFVVLATAAKASAVQMKRSNKKLQGGAMPAMDADALKVYNDISVLPKED